MTFFGGVQRGSKERMGPVVHASAASTILERDQILVSEVAKRRLIETRRQSLH